MSARVTILKRGGRSAPEIDEALARLDAEQRELTQIADGIAVRQGTIDTFVLPYDGEFVSDHLPTTSSAAACEHSGDGATYCIRDIASAKLDVSDAL